MIPHPGLGEGGKYHFKEIKTRLADNEMLTFALAGNQNCGKTTLLNQLTGSSQHVEISPACTVDRKDGNYPRQRQYSCYRPSGNLFYVSIFQ